ncbi:MAG: PQQ-binding-like beta-propeller repeat protein [Gemmatimonadales bacterium]|nr:PQQ-binding-like beta-propeller repeat protein [Gemmatimonadales bacterium]
MMRIPAVLTVAGFLALSPAAAQNPPPAWGPQTWDETIRRATNLAREQPRTSWEQVITGDAVDLIEFIGPDRVLTGYVDISRLGEPNHDKIVLVNAADGSVIWTADRLQYQRGTYSLFRTVPHIVLLGSDAASFSLTALDTATGKRVWQRNGRAPFQLALSGGGPDRYLVLAGEGQRSRLEAMDAASGRVLWKREIPETVISESTAARLIVSGDTAIVVGREVLEIDAATGATLRTITARATGGDQPNALLAPDGSVVLWNEGAIEWIDRGTGASRWVSTDSGTATTGSGALRVVSLEGGDVMRVGYREATGTSVVDRLRGSTGARVWRYVVRGIVVSPLVVDSALMVLATDSTLVGFDAATGTHRFQQAFPADFAAGGPSYARRVGMPDIVEQRPNRAFIARERAGVIAYELPAGRMLWFQPNYERPISALDYTAQGRYDYMVFIMALQGRTRPGGPPSMSVHSPQRRQSPMLQSAQRDYQAARVRYEAVRRDPTVGGATRSVALSRLRFAADQQYATAQIEANLNKMAANLELGISALNFAFGLMAQQRERMQAGLESRAFLVVLSGAKARNGVFQDDFYLWPFYKRGRGVTLVSLETGKRRDIVVAPHSEALLAFSVDYPVFRMGPDGQLLAAGISLRPDRYVDQKQWKLTKAPNLSLLSYDVDSIAFIDRTRDWSWLVDAIRGGNEPMLTGFLDRNEVDVNARHWAAGETALMFAASLNRLDFARLLVARGANVNAVSDLGQTALDIAKAEPMREYLRSVGGKPASP